MRPIQAGLSTTSHNISNAGTTGYSRQRIEQSTNPAMFTGSGFFGEGTKVDTVKRAYNTFLTNQVLAADTKFNEYDTFSTEIGQIVQDNMIGKIHFSLVANGQKVGSINAENWRA